MNYRKSTARTLWELISNCEWPDEGFRCASTNCTNSQQFETLQKVSIATRSIGRHKLIIWHNKKRQSLITSDVSIGLVAVAVLQSIIGNCDHKSIAACHNSANKAIRISDR